MKIGEDNFIEQLLAHREEALLYVIDTYGGLLRAVVRKHLYQMPDKQEECFYDVLMNIWDNIDSFDREKNTFKNWAAAVAKYRAIDYLRRYQRELQAANWEEIKEGKEDAALSALITSEISREMEEMLSYLKPKDRELFWRLFVEEETVESVSASMGMSKDVIYNRVSRGKKRIRRQAARAGKGYGNI